MKKQYLLLSLCIFCLSSCALMVQYRYQLVHEQHFVNKEKYLAFLTKKKCFHQYKIVLPKDEEYLKFIDQHIALHPEHIPYLGAFVNDSIQVAENEFLTSKRNCPARILTSVKEMMNTEIHHYQKINTDNRFQAQLNSIAQDFPRPPSSLPIRLYFVYASGFGKLYKKLYTAIGALAMKYPHRIELYLIGIDPITIKH